MTAEAKELTAEDAQLSEISKTVEGAGFAYSRLNCVGKQICGLTLLAEYPFLRHLDLSQNCIKDVRPISSLRHVLSLNLSSNAISSVDWAPEDLRHLLFLDMNSNKLSELPQLHMPALRRADFRDNEIVSCAKFSGHAGLQTLRLSGNQLSSVQGLQAMPKLEVLELSGNALSSLDVTKLPALASLDISKNKFETLAGPWQEMAALASLDASGNALAEVKALEPLQQMEALRSFAMAGCPLEEQEGLNLRLEILIFRTLQMINGEEVPPEERDEAQALHEKRLEEEAERLRQEEEARLAAEEAAKEGQEPVEEE